MQLKQRPVIISLIIIITIAGTAKGLEYSSYIFTSEDIIFFSYEDGTDLEIYDSSGNPVAFDPCELDKGEHVIVDDEVSEGIYKVCGSNKFAVLTGDPTANGISGYYAMDANGLGVSTEFYTYVPPEPEEAWHWKNLENQQFIVFAYEPNTYVNVQQYVNGSYEDIDSFTLDKGEHWGANLYDKWLLVTADKPVSALTCHDQGYFVPSANGTWSGTEFYTYVTDAYDQDWETWRQELTVIAYYDGTFVTIKDSNTQELIWEGVLNSGKAHVESYPEVEGADRYFSITASKTVTVGVQPWFKWPQDKLYDRGAFIPDRDGTGVGRIGRDLIGSTTQNGYLYILAHTDNTHVDLYNAENGAFKDDYDLDKGEYVNANEYAAIGNGLWRIVSERYVSAYSGRSTHTAEFAPLAFDVKPGLLDIGKTATIENDANYVSPVDPNRDEITYEISYNANGYEANDVKIVDYLQAGVDFNSADSNGLYDSYSHTVTWDIGDLSVGDYNSVQLSVKVNESARPGGIIINYCEIESDSTYNTAEVNTPVSCWGGNIIYVDVDKWAGSNTGTSWQDAYPSLQDGLDTARDCGCDEIWVAGGTYKPTSPKEIAATFELVDGVAMYGGFAGTETSRSQRNWVRNPTVLSGDIDGNEERDSYNVNSVVTASDVNEATIVDGFIIRLGGTFEGIRSDDGAPTIEHNRIIENYDGIYCTNQSSPKIINCEIWNNDHYGIYLSSVSSGAVIRNNTIVNNDNYGIYRSSGSDPDISSCIIWGNDSGQLHNCSATYSCIQDDDSGTNINDYPSFADDANNFHLLPGSPCIDRGDPCFADFNETDIDGEPRIVDGNEDGIEQVDMGADEFYRSPADFDHNGIVNFIDYCVLASAWQTTPNDNDYNDICDLADNNSIDNNDLDIFCDDWLWEPAWTQPIGTMMMGGAMGGGMRLELRETAAEFYDVTDAKAEMEPELIEQLIKWLEEIWLGEDLPKEIDKDEWQRGIERIIESLKEEL